MQGITTATRRCGLVIVTAIAKKLDGRGQRSSEVCSKWQEWRFARRARWNDGRHRGESSGPYIPVLGRLGGEEWS